MRKIVAEKLTDQISDWGHHGLISHELSTVLKKRYATDVTLGNILLRWLGFFAVYLLGMSVLGFIGMAMGEVALYLSPLIIGVFGYFMWLKGTQLACDPAQRYPMSGAALVTVGLLAGFGALIMLYELMDGSGIEYFVTYIMLIVGAAAFYTAYRYGLRWPLTLGILLIFHSLGNMHSYGGHGSYFAGIQDERLTLIVALFSLVFGLWHEKTLEHNLNRREVGFGQLYIVFGLLYANLSLWFLTLPGGEPGPVLLFSVACILQIVIGGRLHDGRFTGFGIVFLSIDMYTRLFENFWNELSKGAFFLISGAVAMAIGIALERRAKRIKRESAE